jgi:phosphate transport system protein
MGLRPGDFAEGWSKMTSSGREDAGRDPVPANAINRHIRREQEALWGELLTMASAVVIALESSVQALCDARPDLAAQVPADEKQIDRREVQIERECVRLLALYDPVASDLRRMVAVLKINSDLERIANLAKRIAKRARKLAKAPGPLPIPTALADLARMALGQVRGSFDALARYDVALAGTVIDGEPEIDRRHRAVRKELKGAIGQDPRRLDTYLRLIRVAGNLERAADYATSIAEVVVYLKEGEIIRHRGGEAPAGP